MSSIYGDILLDHYRSPRNHGKLASATHKAHAANTLCGDMIDLEVVMNDSTIKDVGFSGEGCAISQASTSLLTEYVKGKQKKDLINLDRTFMIELAGMNPTPSRLKCLLLPLEALKKILQQ